MDPITCNALDRIPHIANRFSGPTSALLVVADNAQISGFVRVDRGRLPTKCALLGVCPAFLYLL